MIFTFEINDDELFEYDNWDCEDKPVDFKKLIQDKVVSTIVNQLYSREIYSDWNNEFRTYIKELLKDRTDEIISKVAEGVSDKIARKKQIMEMTPKASEIAAIDKDNEAYFMGLIDKAIAKRFK